jgi:hypothetical protein
MTGSSEDYRFVTNLWRFCHVGPQTPVEGQCQVDSRGTESYSPAIGIGGGMTRVAYGVAPDTETIR